MFKSDSSQKVLANMDENIATAQPLSPHNENKFHCVTFLQSE